MSEVLFISIKPEFTDKIFKGSKSIELRKSTPSIKENTILVIYSTVPVKAVIGISRVKNIIKMPPKLLWEEYSDRLGIDERRFFEYYENSEFAVGLELANTFKLPNKIPLNLIREFYPSFHPPQTFKYLSKREAFVGFKKANIAMA
ncbi:ASCH domain-containing protein [Gracilimonas sp.]|jgi:predicted transcriptional regulator|uniref:ASCH domain-containing protein n=1 Tax=Gracilimonas sp. TaxID=1974203 RepID=UPI003BA8E24F